MPATPGYGNEKEAKDAVTGMMVVASKVKDGKLPQIYVSSICNILSMTQDKIRIAFINEVADKCPDLLDDFKDVKPKPVPEKKVIVKPKTEA